MCIVHYEFMIAAKSKYYYHAFVISLKFKYTRQNKILENRYY